jgi:acyl dehydratase
MTTYLTDEVLAYVGKKGIASRPLPAEVLPARRFSEALGDASAAYWDETTATDLGYAGLVMPPTFFGQNIPDLDRVDPPIEVSHQTGLVGELEWEFLRPVLVGERITGQRQVIDVFEKPSSKLGVMVLVVSETRFTTESGEVVAISRLTRIRY